MGLMNENVIGFVKIHASGLKNGSLLHYEGSSVDRGQPFSDKTEWDEREYKTPDSTIGNKCKYCFMKHLF